MITIEQPNGFVFGQLDVEVPDVISSGERKELLRFIARFSLRGVNNRGEVSPQERK